MPELITLYCVMLQYRKYTFSGRKYSVTSKGLSKTMFSLEQVTIETKNQGRAFLTDEVGCVKFLGEERAWYFVEIKYSLV